MCMCVKSELRFHNQSLQILGLTWPSIHYGTELGGVETYTCCPEFMTTLHTCMVINNGNWTDWSAVWSEIIRVISKSVQFEITSMISDQNCTTWSSIFATLLQRFWNGRIQSVPILYWSSSRFVEKRKQKAFYISFCVRNRNDVI